MNVRRLVLFSLVLYSIGAGLVIGVGLLFGDPAPGTDPTQSLLNLNYAAQNGIADRTNEQVAQQEATAEPDQDVPEKVETPKKTTDTTTNQPSTQEPTTTPQPQQPAPKACGEGGSCTTAQVAAHNSTSDCWVMLGSKAYNVTSYVNTHPGGSKSFDSSTCGTDITAQMQGQAGSASQSKTKNHGQGAYNTLNSYYIADVSG